MYERFTDRARKVMQLANQEAQRFNHEYVGTEHLLLGLIKEHSGVAASVLTKMGIDLHKVRVEVEKIVQSGPDMVFMGKLPMTPRTKKAIEYAMEEARNLSHNYVGTEHLLLGLLREQEGVAAQILINFGLKSENIVVELKNLLGIKGNERLKTTLAEHETMFQQHVKELKAVIGHVEKDAAHKVIDLTALYAKGLMTPHDFIQRVQSVVNI